MANPLWPTGEAAEGELIDRARRGDTGAYEEIVRRHQTTAFRVAYSICGTREDAEESVQDACLKAYGALDRFRDGSPFRPWLLRIAANEARNRAASSARRGGMLERLIGAGDPGAGRGAIPEEALVASDERHELLVALRTLPPRHRDAVACRYLLGLSEAETAATLGCRPGTVKSRTARGLAKLRTELEAELDG